MWVHRCIACLSLNPAMCPLLCQLRLSAPKVCFLAFEHVHLPFIPCLAERKTCQGLSLDLSNSKNELARLQAELVQQQADAVGAKPVIIPLGIPGPVCWPHSRLAPGCQMSTQHHPFHPTHLTPTNSTRTPPHVPPPPMRLV